MQYTINSLREELYSNVNQVYQIFIDFYGEDRVDLQNVPSNEVMVNAVYAHTDIGNVPEDGSFFELQDSDVTAMKCHMPHPFIMVWWPTVTITNEHNKSVQIQDLYAKVELTLEGRIPYEGHGFLLNRTTFSEVQFESGYLHSHIPHFSGVPSFNRPCLGTGPINGTIMELKNSNDLPTWMMFCHELALYVTVESLTGVPYFKLETIGSSKVLPGFNEYDFKETDSYFIRDDDIRAQISAMLKDFIKYYLQHGHFTFNYINGSFEPGLPYYEYMIDVSNSFIEYFNLFGNIDLYRLLIEQSILTEAIVSNGKFYRTNARNSSNTLAFEGREMFKFKGVMRHLHIERTQNSNTQNSTLLHHYPAMCILRNILKIINYRYDNNKQRRGAAAPSAYQTVSYI